MKRTACIPALLGIAFALVVLAPTWAHAQTGTPEGRPVVRTEADLPRYTYDLPTSTASELLTDEAAFDEVATRVRADVEALIEGYTIEDRTTRRGLYSTLERLALLRGDYNAVLAYTDTIRALQEKPANRLTTGLVTGAIVAAERAGGDEAARRDAFREAYAAAVGALPWSIVQDAIEATKGWAETMSRNLTLGLAQSQYDPAAAETRQISGDVARDLIVMRAVIEVMLAYKDPIVEVLRDYIAADRVEKPNIWAARDVTLTDADGLHPVVVGIWDTGVDAAVFGAHMFVNPAETLNGRDDDGNGFVDDVHGIAYGLYGGDGLHGGDPTPDLLYPLDEAARARLPEMRDLLKGRGDVEASIDSPEAQAYRQQMAAMQPAEVQPFVDDLSRFGYYVHGTHVAGIAVVGNPAARVLAVRETWPHEMIPPPFLRADAERWAASMQRTVAYLRRYDARVVNMSWGMTAQEIEGMLEANGTGASADERKRMAQEAFDVALAGMTAAIRSAPGILFVAAAGNSDDDVVFTVDLPTSIRLPNVLAVGAVDQAGDETSFTSYGGTVRAHANGFEVESFLPGGERIALSGTSMAAPNVTNLAAKLFALDPSLTPEEVVALIVEGADRSTDGRLVLINPKRSVELLEARTGK